VVKYLGNGWSSGTEIRVLRCACHEWESDSTPAEATFQYSTA
jgi:hypothetical protein